VTASIWILAASLNGVVAVAAGAAATHLFAADPHGLALLSTGAQYAIYHALALLAVAALSGRGAAVGARCLAAAGWLFVAGTVLFSGSLYLLALTGIAAFARPTPFGGVAFMAGWAALGLYAWQARRGGG
jgi:uncharacterized membrane protein YgdD (TMEM256/DUF423 family)